MTQAGLQPVLRGTPKTWIYAFPGVNPPFFRRGAFGAADPFPEPLQTSLQTHPDPPICNHVSDPQVTEKNTPLSDTRLAISAKTAESEYPLSDHYLIFAFRRRS